MSVFDDELVFEWDDWNVQKNRIKHSVEPNETEEVFIDDNKVTFEDTRHSDKERRLILIGKTRKGRLLYVAFTIREGKIRVVSARDINRKEVKLYEETT
jgi:uncharacterized protein